MILSARYLENFKVHVKKFLVENDLYDDNNFFVRKSHLFILMITLLSVEIQMVTYFFVKVMINNICYDKFNVADKKFPSTNKIHK